MRARSIDIPVGVGFCLYLRRDCLNAAGLFRADLFAQGYGEENDLCLRARRWDGATSRLTGLSSAHGGYQLRRDRVHLRSRKRPMLEQCIPATRR